MTTTLGKQIEQVREAHGDHTKVVHQHLRVPVKSARFWMAGEGEFSWMDVEIDGKADGFGFDFYLWTEKRVYFLTESAGYLAVESVPRDPCHEEPRRFGCSGRDKRSGVEMLTMNTEARRPTIEELCRYKDDMAADFTARDATDLENAAWAIEYGAPIEDGFMVKLEAWRLRRGGQK